MRKLITLFTTLCIMASFSIPFNVSAENSTSDISNTDAFENCGLYDDYDVFSESEFEELDTLIKDTSKEVNMYVAVYISQDYKGDMASENFADNYYEELFGEDTDGLLYYMDLSSKRPPYDYISTSGRAILTYTDENNDGSNNRIDDMLNSIFTYLPSSSNNYEYTSNDIYLGVKEICNQVLKYGEKGPKALSYAYDSSTQKYIYMSGDEVVISTTKPFMAVIVKFLLPAFIILIIVSVVSILIILHRYKFKTGYNSSGYVSNENSHFDVKEDRFIRTYTTKTKIQTSSGGSSGGGGGGGGGSHGGGGGHR